MPPAQKQYQVQEILNRVFDDANNRLNAHLDAELLITELDEFQWHQVDLSNLANEAVAGSGATTALTRYLDINTGATGSSTARRSFPAGTGGNAAWNRGKAGTVLNWSKRVVVSVVYIWNSGSANGEQWVYFGVNRGDGAVDATDKAIGINVKNAALYGHAHNGSALAEVDLATTLTAVGVTITIVSDGAGNVEWFVNGTSKGTTASGPTGDSTGGDTSLLAAAANNADASANRFSVHAMLVGVAQ